MARPRVLLATEGTYPFHQGGVSTWCNTLVHHLSSVDFVIFAVAMNPYVSNQFSLPANVLRIIAVPLWGMQDPSEHRDDLVYSEIFLQKQRTGNAEIESLFLPVFQTFLDSLIRDHRGPLGAALSQMYRYFRTYDYQETFKNPAVWDVYKTWVMSTADQGYWQQPSIFESVQGLGWIYHFLTVLNNAIPPVDMVHSSAAAFCGIAGIVSKLTFGTPYLLTEHGVYLREQYLSIGRSNMTPFSKRFLLALVKAIAQENLHYADELVPVCAFNSRWERVLGADESKIRVIYNGVDPAVFRPASASRPPHETVEILAVARVDPNKDLETLLKAIHQVQSFGYRVHVRVLGSVSVPTYADKITQLQKELGLDEVVEFLGHQQDISEAYRQADIAVQSSVTEAFPYSVIEAMMSGLPMVATDVGGTREALGSAGILVPSRDPFQLALGIAMLASNAELRHRLGAEAQERAARYFDIAKTMKAFLALYTEWQKNAPRHPDNNADSVVTMVARGWALAKIGARREALSEYGKALTELSGQAGGIVVLREIARLHWEEGHADNAYASLIKARLLERIYTSSEPQAAS